MYVVVIQKWQELTVENVQTLAGILGVTAFDVRQRLVGAGPVVVAGLAKVEVAENLLTKLEQAGFASFIVDSEAGGGQPLFVVKRFLLGEQELKLEDCSGCKKTILCNDIHFLLTASSIVGQTEVKTVSKRKFSMGKTLMAGGVPMTKKVKRQELVSNEERERVLYLCTAESRLLFPQNGMVYDGLGDDKKPSREMNFNFLVAALRRLCPDAKYDERLLNRANQARIIGPLLSPEDNLDLAVEILARAVINGRSS